MCVTSFIQLKGTDRLCKVIKLSMQWTNSWGFIWDIPYIAGLFLLWTLIAPLIWDIPYIAGLFLLWTLIASSAHLDCSHQVQVKQVISFFVYILDILIFLFSKVLQLKDWKEINLTCNYFTFYFYFYLKRHHLVFYLLF